ncbi:phenylacetate-coenzyme A ligase PaaK-like adenylate-forming protein [Clostridium saccharoperbutylacetonicum]|uniref:Coenzyme F390 synthetase n=1 Tax=Clostridium saccharoperbutylacetonicum N1-4(HMT) TaxID=931276 RepID=M1MDL6_9CLOT|nr:AMP-binding protein [Clostridium saccharoperbutylacetonicum]AGF54483.1 coenzyme F390 synthetase [Clostridium saccharoperbutylacetonicum N1-4(HMT)]NRT58997.1 phenylacetate-coenzyme A ligase PaaK-like adenylate-forming protein [Clostridium saccharoperbutylacetonicum]NSB28185.1 phenylacetate-coenzyme A ligase PaaK-like adenylate-forming protein [Clostridium saccharoperbutylacetonicum]NSB41673.1 phenylacetate-coenzyme A ligase PaaK-like adenylate-forming protein [Clostridium saccharoperbutylacet
MSKTMYEKWMEDIILEETGGKDVNSEILKQYQIKEIRKTIDVAKKSKYYGEVLKYIRSEDIKDFEDFKKLPFTTPKALSDNPKSFLCTNLEEISRIVTINSSGTTGISKRIFFTENDLLRTKEFFRYGMLNLVKPGQRVMILMPGSSPSSIGDLLKQGLDAAGCEGIIYGPVFDTEDALKTIKVNQIDCIVGIPVQVFYLAKLKSSNPKYKNLKLKSVLLSADYVPRAICEEVHKAFNCPVFTHYGMTEMGYGGGVECSALNGYHMRDVDIYTEIIDPLTGEEVTEGSYGEVVITTFKREGMPLIRYKTGDMARFLKNDCLCNYVFKRLDYVTGRVDENINFKEGRFISIGMLDEIMFKIDNLLDYKVVIEKDKFITLNLSIMPVNKDIPINYKNIEEIFENDKYLGPLIKTENISIKFTETIDNIDISNGMKKRKLLNWR